VAVLSLLRRALPSSVLVAAVLVPAGVVGGLGAGGLRTVAAFGGSCLCIATLSDRERGCWRCSAKGSPTPTPGSAST
jgi:hypothetical protein